MRSEFWKHPFWHLEMMSSRLSLLFWAAHHAATLHQALHFLEERRQFGLGFGGALAVKTLEPDPGHLFLKFGAQHRPVGAGRGRLATGGQLLARVLQLFDRLIHD